MKRPLSPHATRQDAAAAGHKRYFPGTPCKHGHTAERFTSSGGCVECVNVKVAPIQGTNVRPLTKPLVFGRPEPHPLLVEFVQAQVQQLLPEFEREWDRYLAAGWTAEQLVDYARRPAGPV